MNIFDHFYPLYPAFANDYINNGFVRRLFHYSPDLKGISERIGVLKEMEFDRLQIRDLLLQQNIKHSCTEKTIQNIESITNKDSVIVSCGHQSCLAGGPLYVAYKILTAIKTAELISNTLKIPVVPLFWLATDDDDINEVKSASFPFLPDLIFDNKGYSGMSGFLPNPSSSLTNIPAIQADNWAHYHLKIIHKIFGEFGIITVDPLHSTTQKLRQPFFNAFQKKTNEARAAAEKQISVIVDAGFKPQVKTRKDDTFLYEIINNKRKRLPEATKINNESLSTSALSRLMSIEYSLPIAVEISGPSEIAYHGETALMYETIGRTMPVIIPRFSATLFRKNDIKAIQEANITPLDIITNRNMAEKQASELSLTEDSLSFLEELKEKLARDFKDAKESLTVLDPSLAGSADAAFRKAMSIHGYLYKKALNSIRRKLFVNDTPLKAAMDFTYPNSLQERKFNFIYFTDKSPCFQNEILDLINPFDFMHQLIELKG